MKLKSLLFRKIFLSLFLITLAGGALHSQELLSNGDFETANILGVPNELSTEFSPWVLYDVNARGTNDLFIETTDVFEGNNAALIKTNGKKGKISQMVNITDNTKDYIFSCYIKPSSTSAVNVPFNLRVKAFDSATGNQLGTIIVQDYQTKLKSEGYVHYGFPFRYNEDYDQIEVHVQCHQAGVNSKYLVDKASLVVASGYENMDFEEGVDYIWRKTVGGTATVQTEMTEVYSGSKAFNATLLANEDVVIIKNQIRQPLEQGKQYTVSAMAKVLADNANADSLKIVTKTYGADHLFIRNVGTRYDINDTFTEYTNTIVPSADEKYMAFEITVYNQAGSFIIDDVNVSESIANSTPEIKALELIVTPNPANDFILIQGANGEALDIKIYDITGKFSYQQKVVRSGEKIDIQFLSKGMYVVEVSNNQSTSISKFIKK